MVEIFQADVFLSIRVGSMEGYDAWWEPYMAQYVEYVARAVHLFYSEIISRYTIKGVGVTVVCSL